MPPPSRREVAMARQSLFWHRGWTSREEESVLTIAMEDLANLVRPDRTVLFLGAGATIPSGAPSGDALARFVSEELADSHEAIGDGLAETCSLLESKYGRAALVAAVRKALVDLRPTGGLTMVPAWSWSAIFTTNFDTLVEQAFRNERKPLTVLRSNFDYTDLADQATTPLYKIHGSVEQDIVDGHRAGMILTERDYEAAQAYRQAMFRTLSGLMTTRDVLLIGYSLRDQQMRLELDEAARLHAQQGTPGRLFLLIHEEDVDRAALREQKGFTVAFGGVDEMMHALAEAQPVPRAVAPALIVPSKLPLRLRAITIDVRHAMGLTPNATRLFNGSAAAYADIDHDLTIPRDGEAGLKEAIEGGTARFLTVLGVAGVGKTSAARRVMQQLALAGFSAWEHRPEYPLDTGEWLGVDETLRSEELPGFLLIDDCQAHLGKINALAERLSANEGLSGLRLVLTCGSNQWRPRIKSPSLFRNGVVAELSSLSGNEIESLLSLLQAQEDIRGQVDDGFKSLSRDQQRERLKSRCSADMYVCLKNIFGHDALDTILLREYAALDAPQQDIYRHVAAIDATGGQVHRQLVLSILSVDASTVSALLNSLEGVVDEYDIRPDEGIYGWHTRHRVISQTIARYKYADINERAGLIERAIRAANPALWIDRKLLVDLCDRDFGIESLKDTGEQIRLYNLIIAIAPGERVPRHRLVAHYLYDDQLDLAEQALRAAETDVSLDPPLSRYKVRLAIRRARTLPGVLEEDRYAMLLEAEQLALEGIRRFRNDKYAYFAYAEVAIAMYEVTERPDLIDNAKAHLRSALDRLLDPQLGERLDELERRWPTATTNSAR